MGLKGDRDPNDCRMAIMQNIVFFLMFIWNCWPNILSKILPQSRGQKSTQNIDQVKGSQLKTPLIR